MDPTSISQTMLRDQERLARWWKRIERSAPRDREAQSRRWFEVLQRSIALREQRRLAAARPISIDTSLPVAPYADQIAETIRSHRVTIISGEAGSGKSTQLPLIALRAGLGVAGMIGHTQPRRIAARSVAARLAQQLGSPLGTVVGFKIRFTDSTAPTTLVKVMTDGVLLAETQRDRRLLAYDCLIIDEAHERSLNIDLLIGYVKGLLEKRQELRVIVTSATLDTERFAAHFADAAGQPAPIIEVPGRTFPIEIRYEPSTGGSSDTAEAAADCCARLLEGRGPDAGGDVLVFLPTEGDIHRAANLLRQSVVAGGRCEVLPLYARLTMAQQNAIFEPHARRRIVLATNVAESSITVPGIRYVVDAGTARISRYAPRSKVQRLPIEPISQAAANQRAGRCGRVGPGVCIRLYDEADFQSRPAYTTPEIRRANLAGTILQMLSLGLGDLSEFPLIDLPSSDLIRDGYQTLIELGAITDDRRLTPRGRQMSRLPVDPRISRMILEGAEGGCLGEVLIVAAALEIPDPRVRPTDKQGAADRAHAVWDDPRSDFVTLLNLWKFIHALKAKLSRSQQRKAWEQNFLSPTLVQQWSDVHRQLLAMAQGQGLTVTYCRDDSDAIHRSVVSGLLSGIARRDERAEYTGAGNIRFVLWPGSSLVRTSRSPEAPSARKTGSSPALPNSKPALPQWIVAAELVETTRRYGRTIAAINPEWLESLAEHLVKRSVADPFWSDKQETAMAYETVTLFGLPIVSRRRIHYGPIDPEGARRLFIEQGIVEGPLRSTFPFLDHNRQLLDSIETLAKKTRQRQWIVEPYQIARFYLERVPNEACDVRSLRQVLRERPELDNHLRMSLGDLGLDPSADQAGEQFPDRVTVGTLQVPVTYEFAPGDDRDGATIQLPVESLGQIDDTQLGWLIPGLLRERIVAAIRSLPKGVRRSLVPAPQVAQRVLAKVAAGRGDFWQAVARELSAIAGEPIEVGQFDREQIEPQWLVRVEVLDDKKQVVGQGRSLIEINRQLGRRPTEVAANDPDWHCNGLNDWTWGELSRSVEVQRGSVRIAAFPAIVDQGDAVGLRLMDSLERAEHVSRRGLVRLLQLARRKDVRTQVAWLPQREMCEVKLSRWVAAEDLKRRLGDLIVRVGLVEGRELPRDPSAFAKRLAEAGGQLTAATSDIARWLPQLAEGVHQVDLRLGKTDTSRAALRSDLQNQLRALLADDFLEDVPWEWLMCYPRYLSAMQVRWDKSRGGAPDSAAETVAKFWNTYIERQQQHELQGWIDPELITFRWMIEELRVSLFAQSLGTKIPVSPQRLEKQLAKIRA